MDFKKIIIVFCLLLCAAGSVYAQRIQDGSYRTSGYIQDDGRIQDANYRTVGYLKSDGRVTDSSYRTMGYIKSDGRVTDSSYRTIGYAKGVSKAGAALFFFFMNQGR